MRTLEDAGTSRIVLKYILMELAKHSVNLDHVLSMILANTDTQGLYAGNGSIEVPVDLETNADTDTPLRETLIKVLFYPQILILLQNTQRKI